MPATRRPFLAARLLALAVPLAPPAASAAGPALTGLGELAGTPFIVTAVSADGSTVVGYRHEPGGDQAIYRWSAATGLDRAECDPEAFAGEPCRLVPNAVSADGSVVVGVSTTITTQAFEHDEAFRWEPPDAPAMIPTPFSAEGNAADVSDDGTIVTGSRYDGQGVGSYAFVFRWTEAGGLVDLTSGDKTHATAASADASVVVGRVEHQQSTSAFRWTETDGVVDLGELPGETFTRYFARAVSADGDVVVGQAGDTGSLAFRWTQATGMRDLGVHPSSRANAVSGDGAVVVGRGAWAGSTVALLSRGGQELGPLAGWLEAQGLDLTDWTLNDATGISADGSTIVGNGVSPDGYGGWIAFVPVPEPGAAGGAGAALAALALLGRRRGGAAVR